MKRKWNLDEDQKLMWGFALWAGWLFFWLVVWAILHTAIDGGRHHPEHLPTVIALCLIWAPTVLGAVGGGSYYGWKHRPRREWVSVEDAREAHKR